MLLHGKATVVLNGVQTVELARTNETASSESACYSYMLGLGCQQSRSSIPLDLGVFIDMMIEYLFVCLPSSTLANPRWQAKTAYQQSMRSVCHSKPLPYRLSDGEMVQITIPQYQAGLLSCKRPRVEGDKACIISVTWSSKWS